MNGVMPSHTFENSREGNEKSWLKDAGVVAQKLGHTGRHGMDCLDGDSGVSVQGA
jgi:hypothetical protein